MDSSSPRLFKESLSAWLWLLVVAGLAAVVVIPFLEKALFPQTEGPGVLTVGGVGVVISALTVLVIYMGINRELALAKRIALFAVVYNALIIAVKFSIAPLSVYQANQYKPFSVELNGNPIVLATMAAVVFLLYILVFSLVYLFYKRQVRLSANLTVPPTVTHRYRTAKIVFTVLLVGLVMAVAVSGIWIIPLLFASFGIEYLGFAFSSMLGSIVAAALLVAVYYVTRVFQTASEQTALLRDIAIITSLFWVGIGLILVYHALWIVYFLVITTLWPLKVVVPK